MEREIEFRAKANNEWRYGLLCKTKNDNYFILDGGKQDFIDEETIGQYVGLKDKHGNKIYEGDILKVYGHRNICNKVQSQYDGAVELYVAVTDETINNSQILDMGYNWDNKQWDKVPQNTNCYGFLKHITTKGKEEDNRSVGVLSIKEYIRHYNQKHFDRNKYYYYGGVEIVGNIYDNVELLNV